MEVLLDIARWLLVAVALFWTAGTAVSETRLPQYWVRMWDFPRAQILVFALLTGGLYLAVCAWDGIDWVDWGVLLFMFAVVPIWQAKWIVPYTPVAPREVLDHTDDDLPQIKVLITNVLQQNEEHDLWREAIGSADADLIAIAEVDETWAKVAGETLGDSHPHSKVVTQDNMYGIALFSRLPFVKVPVEGQGEDHGDGGPVRVDHMVQPDVPSLHTAVELGGDEVRLHVLHPKPPAPQEGDSAAPRDAELILMGRDIEERRDEGAARPTLVMGDLNDVAWSRTTQLFRKISGLLDARKGRGLINSFHAEHWWFRFPLDHIFVSNEFRLVDLKRLDYVGSDHFPILIHLSYEPHRTDEQPEQEPSEKDLDAAEARLDIEREREEQGLEDAHLNERDVPDRQDER